MHMLRIIALCAAGVYAFNPRSVDHSLKPTFQHCTPTEEASFTKAIDIASSCLEKVVHLREKIGSTPDPDEREMHCRYFGISSSVDEKHISDVFALSSQNVLQKPFHCANDTECEPPNAIDIPGVHSYRAFNEKDEVWLCSWLLGKCDSQHLARVVIHELTHSSFIGDTHDYAYGEEKARTLAEESWTSPMNADSYAFYARGLCMAKGVW